MVVALILLHVLVESLLLLLQILLLLQVLLSLGAHLLLHIHVVLGEISFLFLLGGWLLSVGVEAVLVAVGDATLSHDPAVVGVLMRAIVVLVSQRINYDILDVVID